MARQVSLPAMAAMLSQNTSQVFMEVLDITHADLPATIRVAKNNENVTRGGHTYVAYPFSINLPDDADDSVPTVTLTITCIDQQIPDVIRSLSTAFEVELNVVLASSPDTVEAGPFNFTCLGAEFNGPIATITLGFYQHILNQQFPGDNFAPYNADPTA